MVFGLALLTYAINMIVDKRRRKKNVTVSSERDGGGTMSWSDSLETTVK